MNSGPSPVRRIFSEGDTARPGILGCRRAWQAANSAMVTSTISSTFEQRRSFCRKRETGARLIGPLNPTFLLRYRPTSGRVVRRIFVCTVPLDAPGFQPLQQPLRKGSATRDIPYRLCVAQRDQKPARSTACSYSSKEVPVFCPLLSQTLSRPDTVAATGYCVVNGLGRNPGATGVKSRVAWRAFEGPKCITAQRFLLSQLSPRGEA